MVSSMVAGIAVHHISIPTKKCRKLIVYAEQLKPIGTLRPHTYYSTLFGLLALLG